MRSAALATAIALLTRSDHAGAAEIAVDQGDGTMCAGYFCFPAPPTPFVSSLSPAHGPLDGGTDVVVVGSGFRDFGELMRCRFGTQKMSASLTAPEGEFIDATNHWAVGCHSPSASSEYEQAVGVEVALNGLIPALALVPTLTLSPNLTLTRWRSTARSSPTAARCSPTIATRSSRRSAPAGAPPPSRSC